MNENSIKSYISIVLAPWEIGPECLCAVGGLWQHWCLWKDLGASKRLREIACTQYPNWRLMVATPRTPSLQPFISILPITFLAPLNGAWWWPVDGEVLIAHLSKEVVFLLQRSRFVSETLTFELVESESCRLAEVNGSHPWCVYDEVWMDSIAWILELDGM
jgi:hypothetical protein